MILCFFSKFSNLCLLCRPMAVQVGQFYKTCATYPVEVNGDSPCKLHVNESPPLQTPIRVSEDTSAQHIPFLKPGKPLCCYLVRYDLITSIGIIFLGTLSPVKQHRFVSSSIGLCQAASVCDGPWGTSDPLPRTLRTSPLFAFLQPFYLNFTHPLRVKLVYLPSGVSFQTLRKMPLPSGPPPPVGISEYWKVPLPISLSVSLDPESAETFWSLHKLYHQTRPNKKLRAKHGWGFWDWRLCWGEWQLSWGARSGGVGYLGKGETLGLNWIGPSEDAPWGRIGDFRVGIDIQIVTEEMQLDFEDEDELAIVESDELAGVVYIADIEPYSNMCDGLLAA